MNAAVDRSAIVREALRGHGVESTGPVFPRHWALRDEAPRPKFDKTLAATLSTRRLTFTCLVPADSTFERIALLVKKQLAAASVDMEVEEVPQDQIALAAKSNDFQAILVDPISGPSLFRSYRLFYSKIPSLVKPPASPVIDAALDQIRHAVSDQEYQAGVTAFQRATVDDPPALFLAWGERARAVSRRFDVVTEEKGHDTLHNLRLWRPAGTQRVVTRN